MIADQEKRGWRHLAYAAGFCLSLSLAVAAYVNSSFLEHFVTEGQVGLIYSGASLLTIACSLLVNKLTKHWGNKRILIGLATLTLGSLLGLIAFVDEWPAIIFLVGYIVFGYLISINLDVYLENISEDKITGEIRGIFLTFNNLGWLLSPLVASYLLQAGEYFKIYSLASLILVPFIYLLTRLRHVDPQNYQTADWGLTLRRFFRAPTAH